MRVRNLRKARRQNIDDTTRAARAAARKARREWLKSGAPEAFVAAYYEGTGKPWNNPRLSESEKYRSRYDHDDTFRKRERGRSQRYKTRKPRVTVGGKRVHVGTAAYVALQGTPGQ